LAGGLALTGYGTYSTFRTYMLFCFTGLMLNSSSSSSYSNFLAGAFDFAVSIGF